MTRRRRFAFASAACAALLAVGGCAPFATYPPVEGSVGIDNPTFAPVPTIIADAVEYVHTRYGEGRETYAVNLPEGAPPRAYEFVLNRLENAEPATSREQWTYHIQQIRSRGLNAEADVIFPREDGPPGLITLHMRKSMSGYRVESTKLWRIPAEAPPPNYVPEDTAVASEPTDE